VPTRHALARRSLTAGLALAAACAGCALRAAVPTGPPPRQPGDADLAVLLDPPPTGAPSVELAGIGAVGEDGTVTPLALLPRPAAAAGEPRPRLLAVGRVPHGRFAALQLQAVRGTLAGTGTPSALLLPEGPLRIPAGFQVAAGRGQVVRLRLRADAVVDGALLSPVPFTAAPAERPSALLLGLCPSSALDAVAVLDRRAHALVGLLPTGPRPTGVAVDTARQVAYVASAGADQVQAFDLATFDELEPTRLRAGDRPAALALTPDGTLLVVANAGSETLALVDPRSGDELERIPLTAEPSWLALDRPGLRAFVVSRRGGSVTVVDLKARAVGRVIAVEPDPVRLLVSPAGDQLLVASAHAPYLTVHSLPDGALAGRLFAGPGVGALARDPRSGLLLVAGSDARVQLFDPGSLLPVGAIPLPGPASRLAIDDAEGALLALLPATGEVAVVDLASRRLRARIDVGPGVVDLGLVGERQAR